MYVYLIHFNQPISPNHTTQHYVGWCLNLKSRINDHRTNSGARLTQVANQRQISWQVVRLWNGNRDLERWLKSQHNHRPFCPCCTATQRATMPHSLPAAEIQKLLT